MINVEYEIFRLMSKASNNKLTLTDAISEGLTAYTEDNGLYSILDRCPGEKQTYYLELFMHPILSMRPTDIVSYFETYVLRKDFSRTANKIHKESDKKWRNVLYVCAELEALTSDFHAFVSKISEYPTLYDKVASNISDCTVELEYLAGESDIISIRMNRELGEIGSMQGKD